MKDITEFKAKYYGGPADGLISTVLAYDDGIPPEISCLELYNLVECETPLGQHVLKGKALEKIRVAVYITDEKVEDCKEGSEIIYNYVEMVNYGQYLDTYGDD